MIKIVNFCSKLCENIHLLCTDHTVPRQRGAPIYDLINLTFANSKTKFVSDRYTRREIAGSCGCG